MNYLAHFKLAAEHPELLVGNLLADHVKGKLNGRFDVRIESGIRLHRAIDAYTDSHHLVQSSHARFHCKYRRYGGIITDLAFDHFLAVNWNQYDSRPLGVFCGDTTNKIMRFKNCLLDPARNQLERMIESKSMEHYIDPKFIRKSLIYLSKKLKRQNPLGSGYSQFNIFERELRNDFLLFFPELQKFADSWIKKHYHLN